VVGRAQAALRWHSTRCRARNLGQLRPSGQALGGAEGGHVHPDLGDNDRRRQRVHAGNGHQQGLLGGEGAHGGMNGRLHFGEVAPDLLQTPDMHPEQQALLLGERAVKGEGEPVDLAPQPPFGEV